MRPTVGVGVTALYRVLNPVTGVVESTYPTASDADVEAAVSAAHAAYAGWSREPLAARIPVLERVADLYLERIDELAAIITREMGKAIRSSRGEVEYVADIYRYYARNAQRLLADEPIPTEDGGRAVVRRSPLGALLGVMPWNYPYYQVARFAGPNLVAGNTVVLKHAPQCPESALAMQQLFLDAGLPEGCYVNVFADNDQVASMVADPRIRGVSVTGSERAGSAVAAHAGRHLKKVVLELGGSDAYLVLDTDDVPGVARQCAEARMDNAGQACNAAKRFLVADHLYDEFLAELSAAMTAHRTGDPFDPETDVGPLSSEAAAAALEEQVRDAVGRGATVLAGGGRAGAFFEPTVLTDVTPDMRAFHEELFGPVAVVHRVGSVDEAVELANGSAYGLGGAVFHSDPEVAVAVADRLDAGMVWVNAPEGGGPELPFGGTKRSGVGRELGPLGIEEFLNKKLIHVPADGHA